MDPCSRLGAAVDKSQGCKVNSSQYYYRGKELDGLKLQLKRLAGEHI